MSNDYSNPYAVSDTATSPRQVEDALPIDIKDFKKVKAIIKDADQFWVAILLCFICTALGLIISGPWYFVRLLQWNSMARRYSFLTDVEAPTGSLTKKFQNAKIKLWIGMCFGAVVFVLLLIAIGVLAFGRAR